MNNLHTIGPSWNTSNRNRLHSLTDMSEDCQIFVQGSGGSRSITVVETRQDSHTIQDGQEENQSNGRIAMASLRA